MNHGHEHPYLIERRDALLCSVNARLGALVTRQGIPDPGEDLRPLRPQDYVTDVLEICQDEHAEWEDFQAEMDEKRSEH